METIMEEIDYKANKTAGVELVKLVDLYKELENKMIKYINYDLRIINAEERNPVDIPANLDSKQLYNHYLNKFENDLEHRKLLLADIKSTQNKIRKYYNDIGVENGE